MLGMLVSMMMFLSWRLEDDNEAFGCGTLFAEFDDRFCSRPEASGGERSAFAGFAVAAVDFATGDRDIFCEDGEDCMHFRICLVRSINACACGIGEIPRIFEDMRRNVFAGLDAEVESVEHTSGALCEIEGCGFRSILPGGEFCLHCVKCFDVSELELHCLLAGEAHGKEGEAVAGDEICFIKPRSSIANFDLILHELKIELMPFSRELRFEIIDVS